MYDLKLKYEMLVMLLLVTLLINYNNHYLVSSLRNLGLVPVSGQSFFFSSDSGLTLEAGLVGLVPCGGFSWGVVLELLLQLCAAIGL